MFSRRTFLTASLLFLLIATQAQHCLKAQDTQPGPPPDNTAGMTPANSGVLNLDMKLEDLARQAVMVPGLSTPVTTVERQPSTIGRTSAAVFVITPEMIRRSGARSIPDVLRMAPGVDVARINAFTWAISIRGFNSRYASKLLVQIDGRVVYNATFGGVYWSQQDVVLEDVERIEVIRGPGTTMWGSNAVNGVINIITKKASDTQGLLVQSGGGGQDQQDFNTVRYGGGNGALNWRVWGQQFDRAAGWSPNPILANDAWNMQHGGFRMDYTPNDVDTLTLQGDLLNGKGGESLNTAIPTPPFSTLAQPVVGMPEGNILLRYGQVFDKQTSWQIQTYYDHYTYSQLPQLSDTRDTWDIDLQYQFSPADCHDFIVGANYRRSQDDIPGSFSESFIPERFLTQWAGVFAQDTVMLVEDRWYFTLGCRLEYNTFGKFQPEPTARLLFLPSERQSIWIAVSRAARNPTRAEEDLDAHINVVPNAPVFLTILGNPNAVAENLVAYEIGYRVAPTDYFSWDIAGYINDYDNLFGGQTIGPLVTQFANNVSALSYGGEITATYRASERWRLFASYSLFEVNAHGDAAFTPVINGGSPHNEVYLRSSWDLGGNVQWDLIGRYVDSLTSLDVPSYFQLDTRLSWQLTKHMEASFVGQNLLDGHHLEFIDTIGTIISTEVKRSWYGMLTYRF